MSLIDRITDYLAGGGLFNPEMANHEAVRDLLIDCRDALAAATPADVGEEPVAWRTRGMNVLSRWMPWVMVDKVQAERWREDPSFRNGRREIEPLYSATALERVVRERDEANELKAHARKCCDDAEAKLAEARKVIEPFAEVASEWDGEPESLHVFLEWNDDGGPVPSLPVAEFRAARRWIEETK